MTMSKTNYGYDALGNFTGVGDYVAVTDTSSYRQLDRKLHRVRGFTDKGNFQLAALYGNGVSHNLSKRPDQVVNVTLYVDAGRINVPHP